MIILLVKITIAVMEYHDQKQVEEKRVYLAYKFYILLYCWMKSEQKFKQSRN